MPDGARITCESESECPSGYACELSAHLCVKLGGALTVPEIVDGSVQLDRVRAGKGIPIEVSFDVAVELAAPPQVELRAPEGFPLTLREHSGSTWRFQYVPTGEEEEGVWPMLVTLTGKSGLTVPDALLANVVLDFQPPQVIPELSQHQLRAPPGSPVDSPSQLSRGSTSTLNLVLSEPLPSAPVIGAVKDAAGCGPWELLSTSGTSYTYRYTVPADGSCADGEYQLRITMTDAAGNAVDAPLAVTPGFVVDSVPPAPPTPAQLDAIRYVRAPWGHSVDLARDPGEPCVSDTPCFSVKGTAGSAEPGGYVALWRSADTAPIRLIGVGPVDAEGAFWTETVDAQAIYLTLVDAAGNVSDADGDPSNGAQAQLVRHETWVATLGGKVPGRVVENPHRTFTAKLSTPGAPFDARWVETPTPERLVDPDGAALKESGDRASEPAAWRTLFPSNPVTPGTHLNTSGAWDDAAGVIHLFGGYSYASPQRMWDWNGSGWSDRTPSPLPSAWPVPLENDALAYDPVRDRLVMFGGETRGNACPGGSGTTCGSTWEYDRTGWQLMQPSDLAGDGNPVPRQGAQMYFDPTLQKLVMLGGVAGLQNLHDMWTWNGESWDLLPTVSPCPYACVFAFDTDRRVGVLFSSSIYSRRTWEWDGSTWQEKTPAVLTSTNTPGGRTRTAMTYDSARKRVVLFGGEQSSSVYLNDVWEWDGATGTWSNRTPASGSPPGRAGHLLVYDPVRQRAVVYGGATSMTDSSTWLWDGTQWFNAGAPPAGLTLRSGHGAAFDTWRRQLVVFGGDDGGAKLSDTWLFNGLEWRPGPAAPAGLTARREVAMAFDAARGDTVVFGGDDGTVKADTWLFDGTQWTQGPSGPSARRAAASAYDSTLQKLVLFGGEDANGAPSAETWLWDGAWTLQTPSTAPTARSHAAMAYDAARGQVVLYGGTLADGSAAKDTWLFDGTAWQRGPDGPAPRTHHVLVYDASRQRVVLTSGTDGTGDCDGSGTERCTSTWTWDGATWTSEASGPPPRLDAAGAYDPVHQQVLLFGGTDGVAHNDLAANSSAGGTPQVLTVFHFDAGNAASYEGLRLFGRAGGLGYDQTLASAPGFAVRLWAAEKPAAWSVVASDNAHAGGAEFGDFTWATTDKSAVTRMLADRNLAVNVSVLDGADAFGAGDPSVELDYLEVQVDYGR